MPLSMSFIDMKNTMRNAKALKNLYLKHTIITIKLDNIDKLAQTI